MNIDMSFITNLAYAFGPTIVLLVLIIYLLKQGGSYTKQNIIELLEKKGINKKDIRCFVTCSEDTFYSISAMGDGAVRGYIIGLTYDKVFMLEKLPRVIRGDEIMQFYNFDQIKSARVRPSRLFGIVYYIQFTTNDSKTFRFICSKNISYLKDQEKNLDKLCQFFQKYSSR